MSISYLLNYKVKEIMNIILCLCILNQLISSQYASKYCFFNYYLNINYDN